MLRKINKENDNLEPKPPSDKLSRFSKKLKITGTILVAVDSILSQADSISVVKRFRYEVMPSWVNAIYYIVPTVAAYTYSLKELFKKNKNKPLPGSEAKKMFISSTTKITKINEALQDEETKKKFNGVVDAYEKTLYEAFQSDNRYLKIDILLNSILPFVRILHGNLFLLKSFGITSTKSMEDITDITNKVYNLLNNLYLLVLAVQLIKIELNSGNIRKGFKKYNLWFFYAVNAFQDYTRHPNFHHDLEQQDETSSEHKADIENNLDANKSDLEKNKVFSDDNSSQNPDAYDANTNLSSAAVLHAVGTFKNKLPHKQNESKNQNNRDDNDIKINISGNDSITTPLLQ